jgi:hypothetical protein
LDGVVDFFLEVRCNGADNREDVRECNVLLDVDDYFAVFDCSVGMPWLESYIPKDEK